MDAVQVAVQAGLEQHSRRERRPPGAAAGRGVLEAEPGKVEAFDIGVDGADRVAGGGVVVNAGRQQHPLPAGPPDFVGPRHHLFFLFNEIMDGIMPKSRCQRVDSFTVSHPTRLERGLPIGSGEIESAHRYVIQERLKLPGAWWTPPNVEAMLALRLNRANREWGDYWSGVEKEAA